jgi:formylglycine-generating enzyme required for sulfatase activity
LVWPAGDTFTMADDDERSEARAAHEVMVGSFWIDRHEATNAAFARFVAATGHVMLAERGLDPTDHPGMPSELLMPRSTVFFLPERIANLADVSQWWRHVPGAAPDAAPRRVINGGLWLCTPYFCVTGRPRPKRWMSILVVPT